MTLGELKQLVLRRLSEDIDNREAKAMVSVILEDVLNLKGVDVVLKSDLVLEKETVDKVLKIAERVLKGEPLQYVLGITMFHGLKLTVRPGVLIPRPETSGLVDIIYDKLGNTPDLRILDVCTGSGAIAIALSRIMPFSEITAIDISGVAIEVTEQNCKNLNIKNVTVLQSDVLKDGLPQNTFDVIVSNPPYVEENEKGSIDARVLNYEPEIALFVPDENPLLFYEKIASAALKALNPNGLLFFEINPRHHVDIQNLLNSLGYSDIEIERDFAGIYRYAIARLK